MKQLTGRKRHRSEDGKLILQIEEIETKPSYNGYCNTDWIHTWRDATIEDLTLTEPANQPGGQ